MPDSPHRDRNSTERASLRDRLRIFLSFASLFRLLKARSAFKAADMLAAGHDLINATGPRPLVYRAPLPRLCASIRSGSLLVIPQYMVLSLQRKT